jgi:hypothetical protein
MTEQQWSGVASVVRLSLMPEFCATLALPVPKSGDYKAAKIDWSTD